MIIPNGRNCTLCHQYINLTMKEKHKGKIIVHIKHITRYEISKYDNICAIMTYLNLPRNNFSAHAT